MNNSLTEAPFTPSWARKYNATFLFLYNGPSMAPLFKPGDLLCVRPAVWEAIRPGDIVIIRWESGTNWLDSVVHRVVLAKRGYLITQGDNNLKPDGKKVTRDHLIGLAVSFGRQGRVYPVRGGSLGLIYARLVQTRNNFWRLNKRLGRRVYHSIRQSGVIAKIWRPSITRLRVLTDEGPLIKYCSGSKTVARWWPQQARFIVVKPFDLVIPHPKS